MMATAVQGKQSTPVVGAPDCTASRAWLCVCIDGPSVCRVFPHILLGVAGAARTLLSGVWLWSTVSSVHPLLLLCGLYGCGVQSVHPYCCCAVCMAVEYRVYTPYCCCAVCMAVEYRVECTPPTAVVRFVWLWSTELSVDPLLPNPCPQDTYLR